MQTQIIPNQIPNWFRIAYQNADSEFTAMTHLPASNFVFITGTTLETGVTFTMVDQLVSKNITSTKTAFVSAINGIAGTYRWLSWIYGSGNQMTTSIRLSPNALTTIVSGTTTTTDSSTFEIAGVVPTKPVTSGTVSFVAGLDTSIGSFSWISWFYGSGDITIRDIQVGSDGSIYCIGDTTDTTTSVNISGTVVTKPATVANAGFLVKLDANGGYIFSQWFYGSDNTTCRSLAIEPATGDFFVSGDTFTTGSTYVISGTTITKPATTFSSAFVFRLLATNGNYIWDDWIYNSQNAFGNNVIVSGTNVYLGGRSNETGPSFFVSGVDVGKPATTNYSGYVMRLTTGGAYTGSTWIDGPDFDYISELSVYQSALVIMGSSSSTGTSIQVNGKPVTKPPTQNSAGFIFAVELNAFDYVYGLWLDGTANEYNRAHLISGNNVFFMGVSNSNETRLLEGEYTATKPATTALYGYLTQYRLDQTILMRFPLLVNVAARNVRMFGVSGRRGSTPVQTIPITNLRLLVIHGQATPTWNSDVVNKITTRMASKFPNRILTVTSQLPSYTGSDLNRTNYDVVFVYSNGGISLPAATLQNFISNGGGVVFSVFIITTVLLTGFDYTSFCPVNTTGATNSSVAGLILGNITAGDPLVDGVTTFSVGSTGFGSVILNTNAGSQIVAYYSNNTTPLIVKRTIGSARTVAINYFPPSTTSFSSSWISGTDGDIIWANAINWVCPF